jgi:thiol-disulfide isomerase/thioredoxin
MPRLLFTLALWLAAFTAQAALKAGDTPPDLLGKDPDHKEIRLSDHRGSVVLVTFWASWCGYCRKELPVLDVLQRAAGERLVTIAVNVEDPADVYKQMRRQLKDTPMRFTWDRKGSIAEGWDVHSYPNLFVIDQNGIIDSVHVGFGEGSFEAILADVNTLLEHPAPPTATAPAPAAAEAGK